MGDPMICQECGMAVAGPAQYHPHLFCVLWRAYEVDPASLLADLGYERTPAEVAP